MLQYNTKNLSFLKMYTILKDFGIKNNDFFLELKDETLLNVDPLSDDLDKETDCVVINPGKQKKHFFNIRTEADKEESVEYIIKTDKKENFNKTRLVSPTWDGFQSTRYY